MTLNDAFYTYIQQYKDADVNTLRLQQKKAQDFDVSFAIDQIEARKKIKNKLPGWAQHPCLLFPSVLSAEQASSEETAAYKAALLPDGVTLCDLTGGLGVDTYYFSRKASSVTYIERNALYCDVARHNYARLDRPNITVIHADCVGFARQNNGQFDVCYIDPARRGENNKRVFAFEDCEPDILSLLPDLFRFTRRVMVKASPMVDIVLAQKQLPGLAEIHVVSVRNECKELLFVLQKELPETATPQTICVNLSGERETFAFSARQEQALSRPAFAASLSTYLYEPNASILKAGAFKAVAAAYNIGKLHINSHLYTSDQYISRFPGRKFQILESGDFSAKTMKAMAGKYPKAAISARNFPLRPEEIRKRWKIKEGDEFFLLATTLHPDKKIVIAARKA